MSTRGLIPLAAILLLATRPADSLTPRARDSGADAMQQRGRQLLNQWRNVESRELLSEALRRHLAIEDHVAASTDAVLLSRGHQVAGRLRVALRLAELARAQAMMSSDGEALERASIQLGDVLAWVGEYRAALEADVEAIRLLPERDKYARAQLTFHIAMLRRLVGQRREARRTLEEVTELAAASGDNRLVVVARTNLADIALADDRLDDAEVHLQDAFHVQRYWNPAGIVVPLQVNQSVLARRRGNLPAATAALDRITFDLSPEGKLLVAHERGMIAEARGQLDLAERRFGDAVNLVERLRVDGPEEASAAFMEEYREPYESLFALHLRRDDTRRAFATLAQAQGRMFLDARMMTLAETATAQRSRISDGFRLPSLDDVVASLPRSIIEDQRSPAAILAAVRGKHVFSYFLAGESLRLLTVVDGEARATSVAVDLEQLQWLIDDFRIRPEDPRAAEALGSVLLPPESLPSPPARIHIVPVGPLLRVPFAALRVAGARLLDRYEVVYAPSVTGLAAMTAERKAPIGPGLVVADTRSDLKHAGIESRFVVENTGATPRLGADATVAELRAAADQPLLHVIAHSGLGFRGGYLALADGRVTSADILAWRVGPHLVVLPTCASAATIRTEMWDSLAAAFLAAGSQHVVATLASVQDRVAADFTQEFYRANGLRDPVGGVARALRQMARTHPVADWSPFVVAGL